MTSRGAGGRGGCSGERLPVGDSMKEVVEVKGRVRLTEMDRFFKDLRKSTRSRAVMVSKGCG